MKENKLFLIALLFCTACQNPVPEEATQQQEPEQVQNLQYHSYQNGDGTEVGFYHIALREIEDNTYANIYYDDYASNKEIFLCDKPECQHIDASCSSFVDANLNDCLLFIEDDHIYLIKSSPYYSSELQSSELQGAQIEIRDLDGKNARILCTFPEGYALQDQSFVSNESTLYLTLQKTEQKQVNGGLYMQVSTEKKLFQVDLQSGELSEFLDLKEYQMIGADNDEIAFVQYFYEQDPDELWRIGDFDTYDQVMMNAEHGYSTYNLNEKTFTKGCKEENDVTGMYADGVIYNIDQKQLIALSLDDGTSKAVAELPHENFNVMDIIDGHVIIDGWYQTKEESKYDTSYAYSIQADELKEMTLVTKEPKQRIEIYGENETSYFVYYDHDQHMERTWAGTDQYTMDQKYMGLIKKEDFWNNQARYTPIITIVNN